MNPFNDQFVNPNAYRYTASRMLEEAGVAVYLGMPAIDVIMEGNTVQGVILQGEFDKFAVFAKRIVDTTQGASVCALAGKNSVGQRRMWEHCQESEKLILKKSSIISVKIRTINGFCDRKWNSW